MDSVYKSKIAELVRRLHRKTVARELDWKSEGDADSPVLTTRLDGFTVSISLEVLDVRVVLKNRSGNLIESFTDGFLSSVPISVPGASGWYSLLVETYNTAQRQGSGGEADLDALIDLLGDD